MRLETSLQKVSEAEFSQASKGLGHQGSAQFSRVPCANVCIAVQLALSVYMYAYVDDLLSLMAELKPLPPPVVNPSRDHGRPQNLELERGPPQFTHDQGERKFPPGSMPGGCAREPVSLHQCGQQRSDVVWVCCVRIMYMCVSGCLMCVWCWALFEGSAIISSL